MGIALRLRLHSSRLLSLSTCQGNIEQQHAPGLLLSTSISAQGTNVFGMTASRIDPQPTRNLVQWTICPRKDYGSTQAAILPDAASDSSSR